MKPFESFLLVKSGSSNFKQLYKAKSQVHNIEKTEIKKKKKKNENR